MQLFPLRLVPENSKINFMKMRNVSLYFSLVCVVFSLLFVFTKSMNFGIDFTGGILLEARFMQDPKIEKLREEFSDYVYNIDKKNNENFDVSREIAIQKLNSKNNEFYDFAVKISADFNGKNASENQKFIDEMKQEIHKNFPDVVFRKSDFVGPQVGGELISSSITAILLSFLAIMLYVGIRFRWQFSIGIIFALIHDIVITVGILSVFEIEFNLSTIAALLTIIGYSVNDSVVIYDRIRENMRKFRRKTLYEIINVSINETLSRTILTMVTTVLAILSLLIFGSDNIFSFSIASFMGVMIGTYSSVYIAAPILIYFENKESK